MKHVYKITPVALYDVRGLESWLEDMARRGLVLKRLRPIRSTFERGPARSLRYRAEPCKRVMDDEPPQAMLDLYQDFGWDFVCDVNNELLIFATGDENAPEPHSDPELQGALWKKLYRSRRRIFFFELAVTLLLLFGTPYLLFREGMPVLTLLTTTAPILIVYLVFFLVTLPNYWADTQRLGLLVKQLEEGVPLDHRSAYPRRRWQEIVNLVVVITLLAAILTVQNILPLTGGNVRPLEELTAFTPLSLAQVEGEGFVPAHYLYDLDGAGKVIHKDYANFCDLEHYMLCRDRWEVVQTGSIDPENWNRMEIHWYSLPGWLYGLSAPLARELLDDAMRLDRDIWWTEEDRSRVWTVKFYSREDAALLATASNGPGGFQIAAAASGNRAVLATYTGNGDLAEHLDEIVTMVK